ncbi:hypothetical protein C7974DRAFT_413145 [Boeremia exigua]|uniref:uncharacterized protein n=1 Tax=Boeremia exigua TaxID=749465 RepID=UPI001E8DAA04|nr:uncharacterized protein C7974DRAFT_413145 [Boeremia exigua]KAH6629338.1 hypothetical protein C7974DRAFT_413145 [Boeremia exigua]
MSFLPPNNNDNNNTSGYAPPGAIDLSGGVPEQDVAMGGVPLDGDTGPVAPATAPTGASASPGNGDSLTAPENGADQTETSHGTPDGEDSDKEGADEGSQSDSTDSDAMEVEVDVAVYVPWDVQCDASLEERVEGFERWRSWYLNNFKTNKVNCQTCGKEHGGVCIRPDVLKRAFDSGKALVRELRGENKNAAAKKQQDQQQAATTRWKAKAKAAEAKLGASNSNKTGQAESSSAGANRPRGPTTKITPCRFCGRNHVPIVDNGKPNCKAPKCRWKGCGLHHYQAEGCDAAQNRLLQAGVSKTNLGHRPAAAPSAAAVGTTAYVRGMLGSGGFQGFMDPAAIHAEAARQLAEMASPGSSRTSKPNGKGKGKKRELSDDEDKDKSNKKPKEQ